MGSPPRRAPLQSLPQWGSKGQVFSPHGPHLARIHETLALDANAELALYTARDGVRTGRALPLPDRRNVRYRRALALQARAQPLHGEGRRVRSTELAAARLHQGGGEEADEEV